MSSWQSLFEFLTAVLNCENWKVWTRIKSFQLFEERHFVGKCPSGYFGKCESCQQSCIGLQPIIFLSKQESQLAFYPDLPYETFMEHERNGFELILHPASSRPMRIVLIFHDLILYPDFLKPKIRVSLFHEKKDWLERSDRVNS